MYTHGAPCFQSSREVGIWFQTRFSVLICNKQLRRFIFANFMIHLKVSHEFRRKKKNIQVFDKVHVWSICFFNF